MGKDAVSRGICIFYVLYLLRRDLSYVIFLTMIYLISIPIYILNETHNLNSQFLCGFHYPLSLKIEFDIINYNYCNSYM